jgi:hypothetical protein
MTFSVAELSKNRGDATIRDSEGDLPKKHCTGGETGRRSGFRFPEDVAQNAQTLENKPDREPRSPEIDRGNMPDVQKTSKQLALREAALERLTARLVTASDEEIAKLVDERRALREEIVALHRSLAGNVFDLDPKRRK